MSRRLRRAMPPFAARARLLAALVLATAGTAHAAACTRAAAACSEWVSVAGGPSRLFVYRSHALDARGEEIRRALVMVHGQERNAGSYFRTAVAAAALAHARDDTIVIAPRFAASDGDCRDDPAAGELVWVCSGPQSWRNGGAAANAAAITSYDALDAILERLAVKDAFPNLRSIVLAGHSAGGQYTARYAMANASHDRIGIRMRYVVANPSSYTYLDSLRPQAGAFRAGSAAAAALPAAGSPAPYAPFAGAGQCAGFDRWPYGLDERVGYSARFPAEQLVKQLAARPITFLLGELDTLPVRGFDASCPAMAQGPTRLDRGLAYARYLHERLGARHEALVIPACDHRARCMFTAERALPVLFPD